MKLRTAEHFCEKLDADWAWRMFELQLYLSRAREDSAGPSARASLRAAIVMLYAHWEGFIKTSAGLYTQFLNGQRIACSDLKPNLVAAMLRGRLEEAAASRKAAVHTALVGDIIERRGHFSADHTKVVRTANLSSEVLHDITILLGLDYSAFETREKLVDEGLLRHRNEIAHGSCLDVDLARYERLHRDVIDMLSSYKDALAEQARTSGFRC